MILALTLTPSLLVGCGDHTSCSYAASEGGKMDRDGIVQSLRPGSMQMLREHMLPNCMDEHSMSFLGTFL